MNSNFVTIDLSSSPTSSTIDGTGTNLTNNIFHSLPVQGNCSQPSQSHKQQLPSPGYYPLKPSNSTNAKTGDFTGHRPIMQSNLTPAPPSTASTNPSSSTAAAFKITQVGPVVGSNVVVSRMDTLRPTSASPIPTSGPLANTSSTAINGSSSNSSSNNSTNIYNAAANRVTFTQRPPTNGGNQTIVQSNIKPSPYPPTSATATHTNFYHPTQANVTKFTNMTVAGVGSKNPLKPTHYTVPNANTLTSTASTHNTTNSTIPSTHPNTNLSAPNTTGVIPKTTLKASDLIHILPNLFNTLKRRNSQSGNISSTITGMSQSSLAAAVAAAAANHSNYGKPLTTHSAAALVAEQLLSVASAAPLSDESSSSPPPYNSHSPTSMMSKRLKLYSSADIHQCEVCGKNYKHRNCLSKHRWEHHESWEHTKKVCQTKHQQVQLLEAAQVLAEIVLGVQPDIKHEERDNSFSDDSNADSNDDEDGDGEIDPVNLNVNDENNSLENVRSGQQNTDQREEGDENVSIGDHEFEAAVSV